MSDTDVQAPAIADFPLPDHGWTSLDDRVVMRVSGPGTDKFLQGQFSQNLDEVTDSRSPRAAASTPKGRAYCLTRMVRAGADVLMDFPAELADDDITHLRKYLMLFRGTGMEAATNVRVVGILGNPLARSLAGDRFDQLAEPCDSVILADGILIRTEPTAEGCPRFEFWQTGPDALALTPD
ncbi:MAG: folate-binding protein, partial [Pseudomonadota bacterium]|nr:folate-binding protein [Pseudomonadota bacterium]